MEFGFVQDYCYGSNVFSDIKKCYDQINIYESCFKCCVIKYNFKGRFGLQFVIIEVNSSFFYS